MSEIGIAVVFTSRVVMDKDGYAYVEKTYNTPFSGPRAKARALAFKESEEERGDFPESKGWNWYLWCNAVAVEEWVDEFMSLIKG